MAKDELGHGSESKGVSTQCSCGNPGCATRINRGLTPFCQMARTSTSQKPTNTYGSYAEAAKNAKEGQRVRAGAKPYAVRSGPRTFTVEDIRKPK